MRLALLLAALPLTGAIPRAPPDKRAVETPDPEWNGPPYDPEGDETRHKPGTITVAPAASNVKSTNGQSTAMPKPSTTASTPATVASDFKVTILADSNRDGKVDVTGETDLAGKETWTAESGALLLANIVDTDRRCSSQITGSCASELSDVFFLGTSLPERPMLDERLRNTEIGFYKEWLKNLSESDRAEYMDWVKKDSEYQKAYRKARAVDQRIAECHDSSDDVLRNSTYLAPLRTTPNPGLGDSAIGSITVADTTAASKVRLFHKTDGQWNFIASNYTFHAQDLRAGLELGIDARDVRRPGGWDGRVTVEFKVKDMEREARDSVALRVAPILTHHHGQPAEQLLTASGDEENQGQALFIKELEEISRAAGLKKPLHVLDTSFCEHNWEADIWAQDFFEPGYTSIPGPDGPIGLHVMIRAAETNRMSGRLIFQELRSNMVGAVQHLADGDTTDSTGNLETVPPYTYNGKSYPAGRAIMGSADGKKPYMMAFLEAQETQAPIELDASWLAVRHVDEFMQFLPVESERGWVMVVDDPRTGLEILEKAQQAGHGQDSAVSRPRSPTDGEEWRVINTIDDVLNGTNFAGFQDACARSIEKNVDIIKRETGITDAEIIRLPALYHIYKKGNNVAFWQYAKEADGGQRRRQVRESAPQQGQRAANGPEEDVGTKVLDNLEAITLYPGTINSVVLNDRQILAPNPWGPVIDGQDVLAAAADAAYAKAGYTVRYTDDWFTHHGKIGEVHCGSNVVRDISGAKWW